jgi:hypothetical protein
MLITPQDSLPPAADGSTSSVDRDLGAIDRPLVALQQLSRGLAEPRPVPASAGRPEEARGSEGRVELTAVGRRYLTEDLNFWTGPGETYELLSVLPVGRKVAVTGQRSGGWTQVLIGDRVGWVNSAYLSSEPEDPEAGIPAEAAEAGSSDPAESGSVSDAACPSGSSVESGLTADAIRVHRAVCALFPEVTSYGGLRSDGEHGEGRALDIMVASSATGDAVAEWVRANAQALGASEILWAQHIWTVERSAEGWRTFEDRGSVTANHYDHVHVTVYGDSAG